MKTAEKIVIEKLKQKIAKVKSGELKVTAKPTPNTTTCPFGYYWDAELQQCILDVG